MIRLSEIKLELDYDFNNLFPLAVKLLKTTREQIITVTLFKKSIDARKKDNIIFTCAIDVEVNGDEAEFIKNSTHPQIAAVKKYVYTLPPVTRDKKRPRPIIIGAGPAGLFAALTLAEAGQKPILFERGRDVDTRTKDVADFWKNGIFSAESNVQFGEGGAGTFSDGKLNTGTKDERARKVLECFVKFGAPEEILYSAKPHIGTDKLIAIVKKMREEIISLGGEVNFSHKLTNIHFKDKKIESITVVSGQIEKEIACDTVILAIGHSARDTFTTLYESGVPIVSKPFSVGVRIEHKQEFINKAQYGKFFAHPALGAADYKLAIHLPNGRSVYSFCVCPGGEVVAAASENETIVTNGMSHFARNGKNINSALLVGITPEDFGSHPLAGMEFQRAIEKKAYQVSNSYKAPAQLVGDFLGGIPSQKATTVPPTYTPDVAWCDLQAVLPDFVTSSLRLGIRLMDNKIRGFSDKNAVLIAPETRSSSPIRIIRNEQFQSDQKGLYPCGEGAGYAGGIMSAAVDGIKCAEAVLVEK